MKSRIRVVQIRRGFEQIFLPKNVWVIKSSMPICLYCRIALYGPPPQALICYTAAPVVMEGKNEPSSADLDSIDAGGRHHVGTDDDLLCQPPQERYGAPAHPAGVFRHGYGIDLGWLAFGSDHPACGRPSSRMGHGIDGYRFMGNGDPPCQLTTSQGKQLGQETVTAGEYRFRFKRANQSAVHPS